MSKDKKIIIELIIVLGLVIFGLWSMTRDSAPDPETAEKTEKTAE